MRESGGCETQMLKRVLGGRSRHNEKAFTWRFVLDRLKLRNFQGIVMNIATVDDPGCDYSHPFIDVHSYPKGVKLYVV